MRLGFIFFLIASFFAQGQDTLRYDQLIVNGEGAYKKVSYRSSVTGGKQRLNLKNGEWKYYDETGALVKIENYKVNRSKRLSKRHGVEMYLNPFTGDTILVRQYEKGQVRHQWASSAMVIVEKRQILHIFKDFESFSIHRYPNLENYPVSPDFVSVWQSSIADPDLIKDLESYHIYEDSMGDPQLMEKAVHSTHAQYNYVNNPEFEIHPKAPFSVVSFTNQVENWVMASESPDFYISPSNARSGTSFIGFRVFTMKKHIEYVQNRLKAPLKKDSLYCFTAFLKLSPNSKFATNAFGVKFTEGPMKISTDQLLSVKADVVLDNQVLNYKTRWMKVQCTYKAKGGEQWMVLGSFQDHRSLALEEVPGDAYESYYYLDDVSLVPVAQKPDCPCNFSRLEEEVVQDDMNEELEKLFDLQLGEKIVLEDIHFENDRTELLPASFSSLNNILYLLNAKPNMVIELSGHTSGLGTLDHNMQLSRRRAEATKAFLVLNGINEERIATVGYGPSQPIASDETLEGQLLNRRVEFKIIQL